MELVWGRLLGRVDDEDIEWGGGGFELHAQLFLDRGEDRRPSGGGRVGRSVVRSPVERIVIAANDACMVENDPARRVAKDCGEIADCAILGR